MAWLNLYLRCTELDDGESGATDASLLSTDLRLNFFGLSEVLATFIDNWPSLLLTKFVLWRAYSLYDLRPIVLPLGLLFATPQSLESRGKVVHVDAAGSVTLPFNMLSISVSCRRSAI